MRASLVSLAISLAFATFSVSRQDADAKAELRGGMGSGEIWDHLGNGKHGNRNRFARHHIFSTSSSSSDSSSSSSSSSDSSSSASSFSTSSSIWNSSTPSSSTTTTTSSTCTPPTDSSSSSTCSDSSTSDLSFPSSSCSSETETTTTYTTSSSPTTSSSSSSSSTSTSLSTSPAPCVTCATEEPLCQIIVYDNLNMRDRIVNIDGNVWQYLDFGTGNTTDGTLTFDSNGGFLMSDPYTSSVSGLDPINDLSDKYKFFIVKDATIPTDGNLYLDLCASAQVFGLALAPFPFQIIEENDFRLAAFAFLATDFAVTGLQFGFIVTNDRIYATYARLPPDDVSKRLDEISVWAFTYVVPVAKRKVFDINNMKMDFDGVNHTVKYYVDGKLVLTIERPGLPFIDEFLVADYGGTPQPDWPAGVSYGFGSMSFMDYYPACKDITDLVCTVPDWKECSYPRIPEALVQLTNSTQYTMINPILGNDIPATFFDPLSLLSNKQFGQGITANLQKLVVFSKSCLA